LAANNRPIHHARVENILIDGKNVGTNVNGLLMRSFRCEVIGVDCANCTGNGFHFAGYDSTQVAPNGWSLYDSYVAFSEARFNGLSGFFLDNNSTDMHFVGLVSHDNTRDGFEFYASSSPQFQSFQPYSNGRFGVSFVGGGSRFKISNGKIEGNGYGGLKVTGIAGSYSIDATLTGANAAANPRALGSAIPTAGCANGLIQNSSFANNSRGKGGSYSDIALGSGIRATSNTIVSNCTFSNAYGTSGQSQYNVYLYGGQAQSNLVIDCMFGGSYKGPIGNYGNTTAGLENMVRQCYGANPDDYVSTTTGSALPSSPALNAGTAPVSGTVYRNVGPFSCTVYVTNMTAVSLIRSTGGNAGGTWSSAASTTTISLGAAPGPIVLRAGDSIVVTHTSGTWQWVAML
ncbi:MAG TPA: hypothetical protein VFQ70_00765, partial [Candidatus Saccharimonadaceae bacterium]|nr:hypothetical protein [Candidatus Saccharimonadaceae bacterium]